MNKELMTYWQKFCRIEFGFNERTILKRVRAKLLFNEICRQGRNICFRCKKPILNAEELSFDHIISYIGKHPEESNQLFHDYNNITLSHLRCNLSAGGKSNRKTDGFKNVDVIDRVSGKSRVRLTYKTHKVSVQTLDNQMDAAELADLISIKYFNEDHDLNFKDKIDDYLNKISNGWRHDFFEKQKKIIDTEGPNAQLISNGIGASRFRGVNIYVSPKALHSKRWRMTFNYKVDGQKKVKCVLYPYTPEGEIKAAEHYDTLCIEHRDHCGILNFPDKIDDYRQKLSAKNIF